MFFLNKFARKKLLHEGYNNKTFREEVYNFVSKYIDTGIKNTSVLATTNIFNIEYLSDDFFHSILNLSRINDVRRINKFFIAINIKLPNDGIFICCAETKTQREKRVLKKFPVIINYGFLFIDFIFKRVIPKLPVTKKIYFILTKGKNRILSRAEIIGRLYSCGFSIVAETIIGFNTYFVVKKIKVPFNDEVLLMVLFSQWKG